MKPSEVPLVDTYLDVENFLDHVVWNFYLKHGGSTDCDLDEMLGEARLVFLKVYRKFEAERGKFLAFLRTAVERRLIDLHRHNRNVKAIPASDNPDVFLDDRKGFSLTELVDGLTEDARQVISLILDTPADFVESFAVNSPRKHPRLILEDHLLELGWRKVRICRCMAEIREALS